MSEDNDAPLSESEGIRPTTKRAEREYSSDDVKETATPTPHVDAELANTKSHSWLDGWVDGEFARALETELAEANAKVAEYERQSWVNVELSNQMGKARLERDAALAEVEKLKAEWDELKRKGESLCQQNGNLFIEHHDQKNRILSLETDNARLREALKELVAACKTFNRGYHCSHECDPDAYKLRVAGINGIAAALPTSTAAALSTPPTPGLREQVVDTLSKIVSYLTHPEGEEPNGLRQTDAIHSARSILTVLGEHP